MTETPVEKVDFLTSGQHRDILVRIVKAIEANGTASCVLPILHEWSLIERPQMASGRLGGVAGPDLCPLHKVPMIHTITDLDLCAVCERQIAGS